MPSYPKSTPPLHPDLSRPTETARRWLYDYLVRLHFRPAEPDPECDPPLYSPDDAGLTVFYAFGRWFATWTQLEEPTYFPVATRVELVRIMVNPDGPEGLMLHEV